MTYIQSCPSARHRTWQLICIRQHLWIGLIVWTENRLVTWSQPLAEWMSRDFWPGTSWLVADVGQWWDSSFTVNVFCECNREVLPLLVEDSRSERSLWFIFQRGLWRVVNKDGIRAVSPWLSPLCSCVFFQSSSLILLMPARWHPSLLSLLSRFHHLLFSLFLLLTLYSPSPIHSDSLGPKTMSVAACTKGGKSMCCIPSCSQQPPCTNKAYQPLWLSEEKWSEFDDYVLPWRLFFPSLVEASWTRIILLLTAFEGWRCVRSGRFKDDSGLQLPALERTVNSRIN